MDSILLFFQFAENVEVPISPQHANMNCHLLSDFFVNCAFQHILNESLLLFHTVGWYLFQVLDEHKRLSLFEPSLKDDSGELDPYHDNASTFFATLVSSAPRFFRPPLHRWRWCNEKDRAAIDIPTTNNGSTYFLSGIQSNSNIIIKQNP